MKSPRKQLFLFFGDLLVGALAIALTLIIRHGGNPDTQLVNLYLFATPFLLFLWCMGFIIFGLYDIASAKNTQPLFERLGRAIFFNFVVTVLLFYLIPEFRLRPLVTLAIMFVVFGALITAWRAAANALFRRRSRERVLFWGITPEIVELAEHLIENPQIGFRVFGFSRGNGNDVSVPLPAPLIHPSSPTDAVRANGVRRIVIAPGVHRTPELERWLFDAVVAGAHISEFLPFYEQVYGKVPVSLIQEGWFIENLIGLERPTYESMKRIMDLTFAVPWLLVSILLLPFIALGILLSTPGDLWHFRTRRARVGDGFIFFRQERMGRGGKPFWFVKFRSQRLGAERMGNEKLPTEGDDPRAYFFGTLLRKTYLDELPQVWNILRGEMSFVGPRPERPAYVSTLEQEIPFYRMRELVLPGITGLAQIGMHNDASVSDAPEKMQYDLYYIKNRSILLDLAIILKTALKLLQRSGR